MEKEIVYVINRLTDRYGYAKEHLEDIHTQYIPYVVKVGQSAFLSHAYINADRGLKTSTVEEVSYIHGMLVITTKNTVYWMRPIIV